jgi:hypothetical protein
MNKETTMKTLNLTLSKLPFDVMVTGEKVFEYRKDKPSEKTGKYWMRSRLYNKDGTEKKYDLIRFTNGYGAAKPYFVAEYNGFHIQPFTANKQYSNLVSLTVEKGDFVIELGKIIESGNLTTKQAIVTDK